MNQERNSAFKNICTTRGGLEHEQQNEYSLHESGRLSGQQQPQLYNFMDRDSLNKQYYRDDEYLERKSAKSQMSLEEQFQKFSIQSRQSNFMLFNRASIIQPKSSLGYGSQKPSIEFSQKNSLDKYQRFSNGSQSLRSNRSSSQPEQQSLEIVMEWQDNEENPQVIEELIKKLTLEKQSEYRPDRLSIQPQQKQGCICKRTQCLKFYCQCFQAGKLCTDSCECMDCCNNDKNQQILEQTKQQIIQKNPEAFQPVEILKTCSCKKSRCLKKYCECYHSGQRCGEQCKCEGCENKIEEKQELLRAPQELYPPYGKKVQLSRIEF
ncbi:hypothetical protein pb186bvf_007357 [Paramecium bursaria]